MSQVFIRGLQNLPVNGGAVAVTIGNFDGVHLGHQAIMAQVCQRAAQLSVASMAIIFEPHPLEFFDGDTAPPRILSVRGKAEAIWNTGVEQVMCLPFNTALRAMTAQQFIENILVQALHVGVLIVGQDFHFGCDRRGNLAMLQQAGKTFGFKVVEAVTVEYQGQRVSSTRIRNALLNSEFALAKALLGRPYQLSGHVMHGQKLGRQLGVPTANVSLKGMNVPVKGVYVTQVYWRGHCLPAVANVGVKPTVSGEAKALLEVHILNWQGDLYGEHIQVEFLEKIRDEKRFSGKDELLSNLQRDLQVATTYFAQQGG